MPQPHSRDKKVGSGSVGSGSVDVGKARDAATDRFFARKQDNSTLESYTGRTK